MNNPKHDRLYNPITNNFFISRDAKFMEDMSWNEMENGTCHNPFVVLDEHQDLQIAFQDCTFKLKTILHPTVI